MLPIPSVDHEPRPEVAPVYECNEGRRRQTTAESEQKPLQGTKIVGKRENNKEEMKADEKSCRQ
jgi:hypothetical protein